MRNRLLGQAPRLVAMVALAMLATASLLFAASKPFHGNKESRVFHAENCQHYSCKNCTIELKTYAEAIDRGFRPCKVCRPSSGSGSTTKQGEKKQESTATYVGNTSSRKLHRSSCRHASCANCSAKFTSRDAALKAGYVPGKCCNP